MEKTNRKDLLINERQSRYKMRYVMVAIIVLVIVVLAAGATVTVLLVDFQTSKTATPLNKTHPFCNDSCVYTLVESIPINLTYPGYNGTAHHPTVYAGWVSLLEAATESIDIASSYWSLRGSDIRISDPSTKWGEDIYNRLLEAGTKRGIKIRIAQTEPSKEQPGQDTIDLQKAGAAQFRSLNFDKLIGAGILHSKMWLVDKKHFYVGSANLDWRSLTQVKELGSITYNCSCLAEDMAKIFSVYWDMGAPNASLPSQWPDSYNTNLNKQAPLQVDFNGIPTQTYLSSSPPEFCPPGRTIDVDAIVDIIQNATEFIDVAVMEYFPQTIYLKHNKFWPVIENALKEAVFRKVNIRVLGSYWKHTEPSMAYLLLSLKYFSARIQVKMFEVPVYGNQTKIPYSRVNHNKYMVTEDTAYIGTSNWSGDYFISTGGIGYVVKQNKSSNTASDSLIHKQLLDVFERDWNSNYSHPVTDYIHH